jgi:hypothetical protein
MSSNVQILHGDDVIKVEMTVKEALALSGSKFLQNRQLETSAIKKVKQSIENKLMKTS